MIDGNEHKSRANGRISLKEFIGLRRSRLFKTLSRTEVGSVGGQSCTVRCTRNCLGLAPVSLTVKLADHGQADHTVSWARENDERVVSD